MYPSPTIGILLVGVLLKEFAEIVSIRNKINY